MARTNAYIGSAVTRIEDRRFLRGRGIYVGDLNRADALHAAVLRSPVAHGTLRGLDVAAARARPGVRAVITGAEIAAVLGQVPNIPIRLAPLPELVPFEQPVIAWEKVRYVGEPLAVVVADGAALAEDALGDIRIDIAPLPAVADRAAAEAPAALLFGAHGSNVAIRYTATRGDADAAFRTADYVRRERFAVHRHTAVPMEPRGLLADWDAAAGRLTVCGAAKAAFAVRRSLAEMIGLATDAIDMVENDVGGGFGVRGEFYPEDFLVPFAARHVGGAVKWVEDRREHLVAAGHAREAEAEIEIACRRDGTILALRGHAFADIGAYVRTNGAIGPRNFAEFMSGPYRIPDIHVDVALLLTNKTPCGTYRAPGRYETDFFRERLMDIAAKELGIDRVEFRRRNLVQPADMPYRLARITPFEHEDALDSGDHPMTLDRCLAAFGWAEKAPLQGRLIDGRRHGLALACFVEGGAAGPRENARLVLEPDGTVAVYVGSSGIGQGVETAFAQIAADALEIPMERIRRVYHGSTAHVREGFGSYHSRSIVMGGSAILLAAAEFRDRIRAAAAARLGCAAAEVEIADGAVATAPGGRAVPLADLAADGIDVEATFKNHRHTWAYGAHAVHIAVDPDTGAIAVLDYAAVEDAGRIINPDMLKGQAIGAIAQGIGGTLLEQLVYDADGQPQSTTLADYLMPSACDVPRITAIMLEAHPSPINPLGAKGAGEGGIIPVGGLIANALANAFADVGLEPLSLPLTPPRVCALLHAPRAAK